MILCKVLQHTHADREASPKRSEGKGGQAKPVLLHLDKISELIFIGLPVNDGVLVHIFTQYSVGAYNPFLRRLF
jgi:hypothetical protein